MLGHDFCEQRNCINFDDYRKRVSVSNKGLFLTLGNRFGRTPRETTKAIGYDHSSSQALCGHTASLKRPSARALPTRS